MADAFQGDAFQATAGVVAFQATDSVVPPAALPRPIPRAIQTFRRGRMRR